MILAVRLVNKLTKSLSRWGCWNRKSIKSESI